MDRCVVRRMKDGIVEDIRPVITKIKRGIPVLIVSLILAAIFMIGFIWLVDHLTAAFNDKYPAVFIAATIALSLTLFGSWLFLYLQDKYKAAVEACK